MKYKGTDNKEYNIKLKTANGKFRSGYHEKAHILTKSIYPLYPLYEEIFIPGCKNKLYLDLFIPSLGIAIEVQSELHYKFVPHFHQNVIGYAQAKARDAEKRLWCEINGIQLIELVYNETEEQWKQKLTS